MTNIEPTEEEIKGYMSLSSAKTGVFTINRVQGIFGDLCYNSINLDFDERQEENKKEYHEELRQKFDLPEDYDFISDPQEVVNDFELDDYMNEEYPDDTRLIGFIKDEDCNYVEDPNAEYSCVLGESYGQVTQSKYVCQCYHCSPCYPHQGDLETEGIEWAFTLPPDVWCDDKPEWMIIFELDTRLDNLTGICVDLAKKGVFIPL